MKKTLYIVLPIIIGILVGIIDFIFYSGLEFVSKFRDNNLPFILIFLPVIGLIIVYFYQKYGKQTAKGMGLVFKGAMIENSVVPKRLVPFVIISTWLTHLFGGSAGREGVAVQVGGTIGSNIFKYVKNNSKINIDSDMKKILVTAGMSGGFAGLFGTPFAAIIFSVEVLKTKKLEIKALVPSVIASFTALWITNILGMKHFKFLITEFPQINIKNILLIILCGIIFGLTGFLFVFLQSKIKKNNFFSNLNPYKKIFFGGIILVILLFFAHSGRYSGLGTNLINDSLVGNKIYSYDFILKLIFTVATLSIGFQGGEVTPLFSMGASLGAVLGIWLNLPFAFLAALGYATVFCGATNTVIASIIIGSEIFGIGLAPYLVVVCVVGRIFSGKFSIYSEHLK